MSPIWLIGRLVCLAVNHSFTFENEKEPMILSEAANRELEKRLKKALKLTSTS